MSRNRSGSVSFQRLEFMFKGEAVMRMGLLMLLSFCSAVCAAESAAVNPAPATAPVVLVELVRQADVIVKASYWGRQEKVEGGTVLEVLCEMGAYLKGWVAQRSDRLFVPDGSDVTLTQGERYILFARMNFDKHYITLLADANAKLPETSDNIRQILEAVQKTKTLQITFTTDKPIYVFGDKVRAIWQIKNVSDKPVRILAGASAFDVTFTVAGAAPWKAYSGRSGPFEEDYRLLKPGETFETHRTTPKAPSEGELRIDMAYQCGDNRVDVSEGPAERYPDVVLIREEKHFSVKIGPPDAAVGKKLLEDLTSPGWDVQLDALQRLVKIKQTAALPEVKAMVSHPWPAIRELVAETYQTSPDKADATYRSLVYDPAISVRNRAASVCIDQTIPDSDLCLLALRLVTEQAKAMDRLPAKGTDYGPLTRSPDVRLGDLLCSHLDDGRWYANCLLQTMQTYLPGVPQSAAQLTEAQKQEVSEKWAAFRRTCNVAFWTEEDLKKEMDECRARAFMDFKFDARFPQILDVMQKLAEGGRSNEDAVKALAALGPEIMPTTLYILNNPDIQHPVESAESAALINQYREWNARETVPYLFGVCYRWNQSPGGRAAAMAVALLDKDAARPHLERLYTKSVGAAIALAYLGDKRAVPYIMAERVMPGRSQPLDKIEALKRATGKTFETLGEWGVWWRDEGSKQEWR